MDSTPLDLLYSDVQQLRTSASKFFIARRELRIIADNMERTIHHMRESGLELQEMFNRMGNIYRT